MTNQSMRATFGRKFITSTGLEHPEQLRTPRGSNMVEMLSTPGCAAERIVQLYLWVGEGSPASKLAAMRLLHAAMTPALKAKGYTEANGFLPPELAARFGRRLERSFGWRPNWKSWFLRLP